MVSFRIIHSTFWQCNQRRRNFLDVGYHPIQTALWSYNGTQCGYCSPAMVMNMYSLLESNDGKVTQAQVENSFGGNICRCTGYRPILDAFKSLTIDAPIDDIEDANVSCCGRRKATARYRHVSVSRTVSVPISEDTGDVLRLPASDGKIWYRVENLHQLFSILESTVQNDQYILVAGDTAHGTLEVFSANFRGAYSGNFFCFRYLQVFIDVHTISSTSLTLML